MITQFQRIVIEPFAKGDLDCAKLLLKDPEVVKHTGFRTPLADWEIPGKLANWVDKQTPSKGNWKVSHSSTGKFLGLGMLEDTELPHPEIGYMLARDVWGQGYATEIATALLAYGFNTLGFSQMMAVTDATNAASVRVLIKAGMQQTHYLPEYGPSRSDDPSITTIYFIKSAPASA